MQRRKEHLKTAAKLSILEAILWSLPTRTGVQAVQACTYWIAPDGSTWVQLD